MAVKVSLACVSDVTGQMSLPLNGLHKNSGMEPSPYSPEQPDSLEGPVNDWPDWSDAEEGVNREAQSVQIHIKASERVDSVSNRLPLSHRDVEEEPWDDFEDTEPTSDLSPTVPLSDPVILAPPRGGTTSVKQADTLRLGSCRPLKLTSKVRQSAETSSSWDSAWAQEEEEEKSHNLSKTKRTMPQKIGGIGGLGEEFTIKVKKKVVQDPELDLFADMVPDIKLSSTSLLPLEEDIRSQSGLSSSLSNNKSSSIDTVTFTAKFAAVSLTEVSDSTAPVSI